MFEVKFDKELFILLQTLKKQNPAQQFLLREKERERERETVKYMCTNTIRVYSHIPHTTGTKQALTSLILQLQFTHRDFPQHCEYV